MWLANNYVTLQVCYNVPGNTNKANAGKKKSRNELENYRPA